jgi:flagellar motor switch protein FliN/FliY
MKMTDEIKDLEGAQETPDGEDMSPKEVSFSDIEPAGGDSEQAQSIDFLLDVPLDITVELGKTKIQIGDLLKLNQGSVVELDKMINHPLDIYVNRKLMAQGEVVVVNEKFGIRLSHIISPTERVKKLT